MESRNCCRGVRGATTVDANTSDEILKHTRRLLAIMIRLNDIHPRDVGHAIFSVTHDLDAQFPALAARQLGWLEVPLLCTQEIPVDGALPMCVRILLSWNTEKPQEEVRHVYVREAVSLRPDLTDLPEADWDELEDWIRSYIEGLAQ